MPFLSRNVQIFSNCYWPLFRTPHPGLEYVCSKSYKGEISSLLFAAALHTFVHRLRFRLVTPNEVSADALQALTNGFSFDDPEVSHTPGALDMWTTTDLHRVIANFVDFDHVAIALSEECQCSLI